MPWPTTSGMRNLAGAEAELVRGAIGMMVDTLVTEMRGEDAPGATGIEWFDQWDCRQRLWLLECVTSAFFGAETIESKAAIFDAAADAIFFDITDLVQIEIEQGSIIRHDRSWRQSVIDAFDDQNGRPPEIDSRCVEMGLWQTTITQIGDSILGVRLYQRAEDFRDVDYSRTQGFLRDRGLPDDYLTRIPPLRTIAETQRSIDRIQAHVFGVE